MRASELGTASASARAAISFIAVPAGTSLSPNDCDGVTPPARAPGRGPSRRAASRRARRSSQGHLRGRSLPNLIESHCLQCPALDHSRGQDIRGATAIQSRLVISLSRLSGGRRGREWQREGGGGRGGPLEAQLARQRAGERLFIYRPWTAEA